MHKVTKFLIVNLSTAVDLSSNLVRSGQSSALNIHQPYQSLLDCNFTDSSMCKWSNDPNNWPVNWEIHLPDKFNTVATLETPKHICLFSTESIQLTDLSARLFSPLLSSTSNNLCLNLVYAIIFSRKFSIQSSEILTDQISSMPKLSLLRRQMG